VVCISPLTSIMLDQQQKFSVKGITAEFVGGFAIAVYQSREPIKQPPVSFNVINDKV